MSGLSRRNEQRYLTLTLWHISVTPSYSENYCDMINAYKVWPYDPNGVYLVLIGIEVSESNVDGRAMCEHYCGYHSHLRLPSNGKLVYYAAISNTQWCKACVPISTRSYSPNQPVIDSTISVIAHELAETVVGPEEDSWQDAEHEELGDKFNVISANLVELWY